LTRLRRRNNTNSQIGQVKFRDILPTGTGHRDRRLNRDVW